MDLPAQAEALASTVRVRLLHVIGPLLEGATVGLQVSTAKVVEPEAVQPLPLCVITTVYVPALPVANEAPEPEGDQL
jgi:hypothetical protein